MFGRQFSTANRFNPGLKPLWSGFYVKTRDLEMMVDPGVSSLTRAEKLGINLSKANTVFLSHAHIDHTNDANVIMEMTGYRPKGTPVKLLLSETTLRARAVSHFHAGLSGKVNTEIHHLSDRRPLALTKVYALTPVKVKHSIAGSYGFILQSPALTVGYTADSGFSKTFHTTTGEYSSNATNYKGTITGPGAFNWALAKRFQDVDVLVFNLHNIQFRKGSRHSLYHSSVQDLIRILKGSRIKRCIVDHFNPHGALGPSYPRQVQDYVRQETGKDVRFVPLSGKVYKL